MRKVFLLVLGVGIFAISLCAQDAGQMSGMTTVKGCLQYQSQHYYLTESNGMQHLLTGYANKLKPHVGHEIEVTGTEGTKTTSTTQQGAASTAHQAPDIKVSSIKHIAETCTAGK